MAVQELWLNMPLALALQVRVCASERGAGEAGRC